jgi:hypothetical protein
MSSRKKSLLFIGAVLLGILIYAVFVLIGMAGAFRSTLNNI